MSRYYCLQAYIYKIIVTKLNDTYPKNKKRCKYISVRPTLELRIICLSQRIPTVAVRDVFTQLRHPEVLINSPGWLLCQIMHKQSSMVMERIPTDLCSDGIHVYSGKRRSPAVHQLCILSNLELPDRRHLSVKEKMTLKIQLWFFFVSQRHTVKQIMWLSKQLFETMDGEFQFRSIKRSLVLVTQNCLFDFFFCLSVCECVW